jgi:hypothetical protein
MRELAVFWPRLLGQLAEFDRLEFHLLEGIELEVDDADAPDVARTLRQIGYHVERVLRDGHWALEADLLEPIIVWGHSRGKCATSALTLPELEACFARYSPIREKSLRVAPDRERESTPHPRSKF